MKNEIEIWLIHGANASPICFSRLEDFIVDDETLGTSNVVRVSYNCQDSLPGIVEKILDTLPKDKDVYLVGHSLGGVLAVATSQRSAYFNTGKRIKGVVTLSAPFGGSESADYLKWMFPSYHLFKSISTSNKLIKDLQAMGPVVPTLSFITSSGNNPLFPEANDGVVTVNSQRALKGVEKAEVPLNHFEVLLSTDVIERTLGFIKQLQFDGGNRLEIRPPIEKGEPEE